MYLDVYKYVCIKLYVMEVILMRSKEITKLLGLSVERFLSWQDSGLLKPVVKQEGTFYNLRDVQKLRDTLMDGIKQRPLEFPVGEFLTADQAMRELLICRKTLYKKVKAGAVTLHKHGRASYFKIVEVDELL